MASGSVKAMKLYYKDYVSSEFTCNGNEKTNLALGTVSKTGYTIIGWRYVTGSDVTARNSLIPYGMVTSDGGGLKVYNVNNSSTTSTMTIRVFYLPNGTETQLS